MSEIEVVHFMDVRHCWDAKTQTWNDGRIIYMGRSVPAFNLPESPFGNPFKISKPVPRALALARFEYYLGKHPELVERAKAELPGRILVCWCRHSGHPRQPGEPIFCHCDILKELVDGKPSQGA